MPEKYIGYNDNDKEKGVVREKKKRYIFNKKLKRKGERVYNTKKRYRSYLILSTSI